MEKTPTAGRSFLFAALHAVVPVNSLLGIYKALVYAKMSDCCEQVALELEFALYEGGLGVPLAGDDLCKVLVRSDNGEAWRREQCPRRNRTWWSTHTLS